MPVEDLLTVYRLIDSDLRHLRLPGLGRYLQSLGGCYWPMPVVKGSNQPGATHSLRQRSTKSAQSVLVKGQLTCCKDVSCMPSFLLDLRPFAGLTLTWMINSYTNRLGLWKK